MGESKKRIIITGSSIIFIAAVAAIVVWALQGQSKDGDTTTKTDNPSSGEVVSGEKAEQQADELIHSDPAAAKEKYNEAKESYKASDEPEKASEMADNAATAEQATKDAKQAASEAAGDGSAD